MSFAANHAIPVHLIGSLGVEQSSMGSSRLGYGRNAEVAGAKTRTTLLLQLSRSRIVPKHGHKCGQLQDKGVVGVIVGPRQATLNSQQAWESDASTGSLDATTYSLWRRSYSVFLHPVTIATMGLFRGGLAIFSWPI